MLASPRRLTIPLLSCLVLVLTAVLAGPATAAEPDYAAIRINEVQSDPTDVVELVNTSDVAVDISGMVLKDDDDTHSFPLPSGTTIGAHGYLAVTLTAFGLGKGDMARLYAPGAATLIDSTKWPDATHATTWGRCADATGPFGVTPATLGAANQCAPDPTKVRINEVRTTGTDVVELVNTGTQPIDINGWRAVDNDETHVPIVLASTATVLAPGGYFSFQPNTVTGGFGLGATDGITILPPTGTTAIATYSWTVEQTPSFGRCPNGTGAFVANTVATPGAGNSCPVPTGADKVKINEVESDPGDVIELINTGGTSIDLGGYLLKDNDDTHLFTIPSGTVLGAGAVKAFDVNAAYGLGKGDSARLYTPDGANLLDSTTWPADTHATTWGRCPNGTGAFAVTQSTIGLPNQCGAAADPATVVKINEVESNGDKVADWVELTNTGTSTVDVSGWKIVDNDPAHVTTPVVVPASTTIAPGAFYAIYTELNQTPGFGLGGDDSATLYLADGTTQVDTYAWTAHAPTTFGRCPDGTGAFKVTTTSTRGAPNACSPVRINEIESDAGADPDWVELVNISDTAADVSGWTLKDSTDAGAYTFPADTTIPAKGYRVVEAGAAGFGFSLDAGDSVRLLDTTSTAVESYTWTSPAAVTYGRCKDGIGDFVNTKAATKGAANSCPGLDTEPWPGSQTVRTADLASTFAQDLSGLVFDPKNPDVLFAAQNKLGTLFKLVRSGQSWVPDTANSWGVGKTPKYLDGTGAPDTEGITVGPDGFLYAASERNNAASGVSRMSILRYDPDAAGTTLTPTDEWNLTDKIPAAGANLGLEGVTWVPDSFLVAGGFVDQTTNAAYKPGDYAGHGTGLYVVAVEDTGALHAFALSSDGTAKKVATITSGFAHLADVTFDPERQRLWAVTDDTHDGQTSLLKLQGGSFVVSEAYERPVGMPNLNNEGFALAPQSRCVAGAKEVLWSDDGDTGGFSLRAGTISCTVPAAQTVKITSTAPASPVVGQTYAATATGGGSGNPVVVSAAPAGVCTVSGSTVTFVHPGACTVTADQTAGQGFAAGTTTQTMTVAKAATETKVSVSPTSIAAKVSAVAPGQGTPTGTVDFRIGAKLLGSATLSNGIATLSEGVPAGSDQTVQASYSGSGDHLLSDGTLTRQDPRITATVTGTFTASGWYTSPVTVSFECSERGAPLVGDCPAPVTVSKDGVQSLSRTIAATDGGEATAIVTGLRIDLSAPSVRVTGVTPDELYVGSLPRPRCVATDAGSGIASCVITQRVAATSTTVTARAVDRAGRASTTSVRYRTLAYRVKGATYRGGKFLLARGSTHTVVGTLSTSGRVYGPAKGGTTATRGPQLLDGTARVRIPSSAKPGSTWKILVRSGGKISTIRVTVTR